MTKSQKTLITVTLEYEFNRGFDAKTADRLRSIIENTVLNEADNNYGFVTTDELADHGIPFDEDDGFLWGVISAVKK